MNRKNCNIEHEDKAVQTIGVTIWGNRVSPVFDSARNLLVVSLVDGHIVNVSTLKFDPDHPAQLVQLLRSRNIGVLICGAVSEGPAAVLEGAGIELIPFIAGDVQKVVETFIRGNREWTEFIMPGCGRKICCQGRMNRRGISDGPLTMDRQEGNEPLTRKITADLRETDDGGGNVADSMGMNPAAEKNNTDEE